MEQSIIGLGTAQINYVEYLSQTVLNRYYEDILEIESLFKLNSNQVSASTYDQLINVIQDLKDLAQNGALDTNSTTTYSSYLNGPMANVLNQLMGTLAIVNIPPDSSSPSLSKSDKIAAVQGWQQLSDFYGIDIQGIFDTAKTIKTQSQQYQVTTTNTTGQQVTLNVDSYSTRSLQSVLELEYVRYGNDLLSGHLETMNTALTVTQQAINTLQAIQNLSNQIQANLPSTPFTFDSGGDARTEKYAYQAAASAYFTQIFPVALPASGAAQLLLNAKQELNSELQQIQALNATATGDNTLYSSLLRVSQDISAMFANIQMDNNPNLQAQLTSALKKWILDGQDIPADIAAQNQNSNVLSIQGHLQTAITAGQNLTQQQREDVKRYMYLFQQFYKAASAMLQMIQTMFDKITQKLGN